MSTKTTSTAADPTRIKQRNNGISDRQDRIIPLAEVDDSTLEKIANAINEDKCVLLIGPLIVRKDNQSLQQFLYRQLEEKLTTDIGRYYEEDGLFHFNGDRDTARNNTIVELEHLLQNEKKSRKDIYEKILEIRFSLVITTTPYGFLADTALSYDLDCQQGFFRYEGHGQDPIDNTPTKDTPLVYSLLGCLSDYETLVLDYRDLFNYLRKVLGPDSIPKEIRIKLQEAKFFLFLGFDFEKWYTQLLLQLLTASNWGRQKYTILESRSANARSFFLDQFNLKFLKDNSELAFLQKLHKKLKRNGDVRTLGKAPQRNPATVEEVRKWIEETKYEQAFKRVKQITRDLPVARNKVSLLISDFNRCQKDFADARRTYEERNCETTRIITELLNLLDTIL